jgi:hypothetical protein
MNDERPAKHLSSSSRGQSSSHSVRRKRAKVNLSTKVLQELCAHKLDKKQMNRKLSTRKIDSIRSFRSLYSAEELGHALKELSIATRDQAVESSRPKLHRSPSFMTISTRSTLHDPDCATGLHDLSNGLRISKLRELVCVTIPQLAGKTYGQIDVVKSCTSLTDAKLVSVADWMKAVDSRFDLPVQTRALIQRYVGIIRHHNGERDAAEKAYLSAAWISQRSLQVPIE